jgi:phosphatidate cytidylyltransferase
VLKTRLATAAIAIPALWLIVWGFPRWAFAAFILAVVVIGLGEFMAMAIPGHPRLRMAGIVFGTALGAAVMAGPPWPSVALSGAFVVGMAHALRPGAVLGRAVPRVAVWLLGVVYVGFLIPHVVLLRDVVPDGWRWVLFVLFTSMGSDTGGYFGGRAFGRHPLLPGVSPSKTVEGALGSGVGAAVLAILCHAVFLPGRPWLELLVLGVIVSALGQIGDLCESALKRAFTVKDSGWIVPGHGGILDRLDSLVLPFVAAYQYVALAQGAGS